MTEKSNTLESIEIGMYIDLSNGPLYLSTYLTDFEPDLEGVDDADFVTFHQDSFGKQLLGKKVDDIINDGESDFHIMAIYRKHVVEESDYLGSLYVRDNPKVVEYHAGWKNYKILEAFSGYQIGRAEIFYFKPSTPGKMIKDRNIPIRMKKKIADPVELSTFLSGRRLNAMDIRFLNGSYLRAKQYDYTLHFNSITERNEVFKKYCQLVGIENINLDLLIPEKPYMLTKTGQPEPFLD